MCDGFGCWPGPAFLCARACTSGREKCQGNHNALVAIPGRAGTSWGAFAPIDAARRSEIYWRILPSLRSRPVRTIQNSLGSTPTDGSLVTLLGEIDILFSASYHNFGSDDGISHVLSVRDLRATSKESYLKVLDALGVPPMLFTSPSKI